MQTYHLRIHGLNAYLNGKRLTKQELLCEVESLARENYRIMCGSMPSFTCHYGNYAYCELAYTLRQLIKKHEQLTTK